MLSKLDFWNISIGLILGVVIAYALLSAALQHQISEAIAWSDLAHRALATAQDCAGKLEVAQRTR